MKRILATVLVVCLLIVPIKAFTDSPTEDATASLLTERNQALTTYLSDNLTERAVYDPEWRAQLIQDFFAEHPQYADLSCDTTHAPQELQTVTVYRAQTMASHAQKNGSELYVTYYDDGSFVFGTLTYNNTENA